MTLSKPHMNLSLADEASIMLRDSKVYPIQRLAYSSVYDSTPILRVGLKEMINRARLLEAGCGPLCSTFGPFGSPASGITHVHTKNE